MIAFEFSTSLKNKDRVYLMVFAFMRSATSMAALIYLTGSSNASMRTWPRIQLPIVLRSFSAIISIADRVHDKSSID